MNGIAGIVRPDGGAVDRREIDAPMRAMGGGLDPIVLTAGGAVFACGGGSLIWPAAVKRTGAHLIAADARVDARAALIARLGVPPDAGIADADLLLNSYERWGDVCVDDLHGDFAFAIWDDRRRRMFAARDHIGARPFYYAMAGGRVVFASEIRGVLAFAGVSREIDESEIARFLLSETYDYFDPERTFFRDIRKLPFGHRMIVTADGVVVERHWHPERLAPVVLSSDAEYAIRLREFIDTALADRLRGVTHSAVHVSGGLDTTALAVLTQRDAAATGRRVTALSWLPPPSDVRGCEHDRIEEIARTEGVSPIYAPIDLADRWRFDADISLWPRVTLVAGQRVVEAARAAGAQVITSGWGGDDAASFGGAGIPAAWLARGRWRRLARYCRERGALAGSRPARIAWQDAVVPWLPRPLRRAWTRAHPRGPDLVNPDLIRRVRDRLGPHVERIGSRRSGHAWMMQRYYHGWITGRIESWSQFRATHGITHVYPLVDRRVLEFIYGSPDHLHVRGGLRRALFYAALPDVLPGGPAWLSAKREDAVRTMIRRYSNAADRARIAAEVDACASSRPHPWIDLDRLRAAVLATPDHQQLPVGVEHALQALVIWRQWCVSIDTPSRQPE